MWYLLRSLFMCANWYRLGIDRQSYAVQHKTVLWIEPRSSGNPVRQIVMYAIELRANLIAVWLLSLLIRQIDRIDSHLESGDLDRMKQEKKCERQSTLFIVASNCPTHATHFIIFHHVKVVFLPGHKSIYMLFFSIIHYSSNDEKKHPFIYA